MTDDLKRQASELYRERSAGEPIPTSDALSMKKIFYIALGVGVLFLIAVAMFGGFRARESAVIAANTPPPLAKEAPPAELLEPDTSKTPALAQVPQLPNKPDAAQTERQAATPAAPRPEPRKEAPKPAPEKASPSAQSAKPALKRDAAPQAAATPAPAPEPKVSEIEVARREMAKDIVLEKNPTLAQLLASPNGKGWTAEAEGADQYLVTFSVLDESSGASVQYVWRVNMATRSITPLSYYARRLS